MTYLIDGHNLIGQLPDLSLTDPNDEAKLVQKLIGFAARHKKRVLVIFDSGLPGGRSRLSTNPVEVVFASGRSSADDVMIGRIKRARDPGQWSVVSNDHAVINAARARRMTVLTSAEFAPLLRPTPTGKSAPRAADRDAGEAADVYVSPDEVEAWLKIFKDRK
jgi:predicted RNA-binding protein with PIN domain